MAKNHFRISVPQVSCLGSSSKNTNTINSCTSCKQIYNNLTFNNSINNPSQVKSSD